MQHIIRRCKHCQKEYTYCTYGNGPLYGTESGCSMEYCGECQKAIDQALKSIPKRMESRWMKIKEPRLLDLFEKIKKDVDSKKKDNFPVFTRVDLNSMFGNKYENEDTIYHSGIKYKVEWNNRTPEDKHISILMEYDLLNNCFTNNPWRLEDREDSYQSRKCETRSFSDVIAAAGRNAEATFLKSQPLDPPKGDLLYMDLNVDWPSLSGSVKDVYITPQPEHVLREYPRIFTGSILKMRLESPDFKTETRIKVDDVVDFIDYKCYFEKYDDEEIDYLVKIECV